MATPNLTPPPHPSFLSLTQRLVVRPKKDEQPGIRKLRFRLLPHPSCLLYFPFPSLLSPPSSLPQSSSILPPLLPPSPSLHFRSPTSAPATPLPPIHFRSHPSTLAPSIPLPLFHFRTSTSASTIPLLPFHLYLRPFTPTLPLPLPLPPFHFRLSTSAYALPLPHPLLHFRIFTKHPSTSTSALLPPPFHLRFRPSTSASALPLPPSHFRLHPSTSSFPLTPFYLRLRSSTSTLPLPLLPFYFRIRPFTSALSLPLTPSHFRLRSSTSAPALPLPHFHFRFHPSTFTFHFCSRPPTFPRTLRFRSRPSIPLFSYLPLYLALSRPYRSIIYHHTIPYHAIHRGCAAAKAPVAAAQPLYSILDLDLDRDINLDLDLDLDNRKSTPQLSQSCDTVEAFVAVAQLCTLVRCPVLTRSHSKYLFACS